MVAHRSQRSDAELVVAASDEDPTAFGELFERWFDRVYDVARNIVRNDDTAAEVAQDVFLTAWQRLDQLDDPERFGGWLLRTSRNRALNRLEKERRANPLDGDVVTGLHEGQHGRGDDREDPVGSNRMLETEEISDARDRQSLVWAAAAALGPRDASLLDLQLRHQLSPAEIADELDLTANNAHQLLFRLRGKLGDAVTNHQLWRDGSPRCPELAALIDGDPFDSGTNKIVQRHSTRCDVCAPERARVVDPTKLFSSVPIAIALPMVRDRAAAALAAEGVPVGRVDGPESSEATGPQESSDTPGDHSQGGDSQGGGPTPTTTQASAPPDDETQRGRRLRRRLGFAIVMVAVVAVAVLALNRPAGDADLALESGPTTVDPAADASGEPERPIAPPPTSTSTPSSTRPESTTTSAPESTTSTTAAPEVTRPPTNPTPEPEPEPDPQPEVTTAPTDPEPVPPTDPVPAPVIVRFTLSTPAGAIFCPNSSDTARTARWFTEEATGVTLTTPNGATPFDPSGSHTFCAPTGSAITLTATGPGGSTTETETVA